MFPFALVVPFLVASLQPTLSAAFSWHLTTTPAQCSNLSISIDGSDGTPPYRVLIMPSGPSPLPNNVEVRHIIDQPFDGNSTSVSFPINYSANSHFLAVVSDANGFGTGGASVVTSIANSNDSSCINTSNTWTPNFFYGIGSDNQLKQCQPTQVWWNTSNAVGTASFVGIIPGGQCFELPEPNISDIQTQLKGFAWTPDLRGGTEVMIVASDNSGMGTGGCAQFTVQSSNDASCFDSSSPTSTPGVAAGSLETNSPSGGTTGAANGGNSTTNDGPNVGLIVGAAVGGIIGLMVLIAFIVVSYYCLRPDGRPHRRLQRHAPSMSNIGYMSSPASHARSANSRQGTSILSATDDPLSRYQPEPFPYAGIGAHNNGYPNGGQGYGRGMAPGTSPMGPPPRTRLDSLTSGSGTGMSDTSSQVGSRYGMAPSQGASSGLYQTNGPSMMRSESGGNVYDASASQIGSKYPIHSVYSSTSASHLRGGPSNVPYDGRQQPSGLHSMTNSLYDASGQIVYGVPSAVSGTSTPSHLRGGPSTIPYDGRQQTSGVRNEKSGGSLSSQMGSRYAAPSVISGTSGPTPPHTRGGPSTFAYENTIPNEPPPAFTPSANNNNPPTGDVKYKITNPG